MKRAVITEPGVVALEQVADPVPHYGSSLVRVRSCGLCTWEQRVFRGVTRQYPFAGGHEIGGVLVSGPADGPAPGTPVAVSRLPRCGACPPCRAGLDQLCAYLTPHEASEGPGGLAELLLAETRDVYPLAPDTSMHEAALVEPLACVLNSLAVAGVAAGTRLAVVGNGFMGILHARAAEATGAEVTVFATRASPIGLDAAWAGPTADLRGPKPVGEFDAAVLIRDVAAGIEIVAPSIRPGGVLSLYASLPSNHEVAVPAGLLRRRALHVTGAASHRRTDFERAARLVAERAIPLADLVHATYPLDRVGEALEYASAHDTGRVIVEPDRS